MGRSLSRSGCPVSPLGETMFDIFRLLASLKALVVTLDLHGTIVVAARVPEVVRRAECVLSVLRDHGLVELADHLVAHPEDLVRLQRRSRALYANDAETPGLRMRWTRANALALLEVARTRLEMPLSAATAQVVGRAIHLRVAAGSSGDWVPTSLARPLLAELHRRGTPFLIFSNGPQRAVEATVAECFAIPPYRVATPESYGGYGKPTQTASGLLLVQASLVHAAFHTPRLSAALARDWREVVEPMLQGAAATLAAHTDLSLAHLSPLLAEVAEALGLSSNELPLLTPQQVTHLGNSIRHDSLTGVGAQRFDIRLLPDVGTPQVSSEAHVAGLR